MPLFSYISWDVRAIWLSHVSLLISRVDLADLVTGDISIPWSSMCNSPDALSSAKVDNLPHIEGDESSVKGIRVAASHPPY